MVRTACTASRGSQPTDHRSRLYRTGIYNPDEEPLLTCVCHCWRHELTTQQMPYWRPNDGHLLPNIRTRNQRGSGGAPTSLSSLRQLEAEAMSNSVVGVTAQANRKHHKAKRNVWNEQRILRERIPVFFSCWCRRICRSRRSGRLLT